MGISINDLPGVLDKDPQRVEKSSVFKKAEKVYLQQFKKDFGHPVTAMFTVAVSDEAEAVLISQYIDPAGVGVRPIHAKAVCETMANALTEAVTVSMFAEGAKKMSSDLAKERKKKKKK